MIYEQRLARARAAMRSQGIDLLLLTPSTDLFYLTGMRGHLFERLACCLISQEDVHFISPVFELGNLKQATKSLLTCHGWQAACCPGPGRPLQWAPQCQAGCCWACRRCAHSTAGCRPKG